MLSSWAVTSPCYARVYPIVTWERRLASQVAWHRRAGQAGVRSSLRVLPPYELPGGTKKHRIDLDSVSHRWNLPSGDSFALSRLTMRPSHSCQPCGVSRTVSPLISTSARQSLSVQQSKGYQS